MGVVRILQYGLDKKYYGLEAVIMNLYRQIDRSRFQFDFLVHHNAAPIEYEDEILSLGGHVFYEHFSPPEWGKPDAILPNEFWNRHKEIKGIHYNINSYYLGGFRYFAQAKKYKLPIRILHAHNSGYTRKGRSIIPSIIDPPQHRLLRPLAGFYTNKRLACSQMAGRWNFGHADFESFHNAINLDQFAYRKEVRAEIRHRYKLGNKLVIGFVGRLVPVKNPEFLLDILSILNKKSGNVAFILLGDGELKTVLCQKAKQMNLHNILFLGRVDNVYEWMQAFDIVLLPSKNEGLSVALVEAQASGLTCIASDAVPPEAAVTDRMSYLSTRGPKAAEAWADQILSTDYSYDRRKYCTEVAAAGYDIHDCARRLENIYSELLSKKQ